MTNSIFVIAEFCCIRGLGIKSDLGRGTIEVHDPVTDKYFMTRIDIDAKVTIEKIEEWLEKSREFSIKCLNYI